MLQIGLNPLCATFFQIDLRLKTSQPLRTLGISYLDLFEPQRPAKRDIGRHGRSQAAGQY